MADEPFTHYFRQVIRPFKIVGLFLPKTDSPNPCRDRAPAILFSLYIVSVQLLKLRFHPIANRFDAMYMLESSLMTFRDLSIILSFLIISRKFGDLTLRIEQFDAKMPNVGMKRADRVTVALWWLFYATVAVYVVFLTRETYLHNVHVNKHGRFGFLAACSIDYPISLYWLICPAPFLVLCQQLTRRFEALQSICQERITAIIARNRLVGNCENCIENMRLLHAELTSIADLFGSSFGLYLTNFFLFSFLKQLLLFYKCLYVTKKFKLIRILMFLQTWFGAFLHSNFSEALMTSSHKIIEVLRSCATTKLPTIHCQEQILLFTTQLQTAKLTITASELFTVDRQLLTSMIMAVTTYIIVIIQLTPDINSILSRFNLNETAH